MFYSCIPFGISNVSGCSLFLVCACDISFVLGVLGFRRVVCCSSVHVRLVHCVYWHTAYIGLMDESSVAFGSTDFRI